MLESRWRKVGRDLWLHKSRTGLATAAICVGIIGAGAVLDTWSLVRRATRLEYDASRPASAVLRVDSIDAATLAVVRAIPAIEAAQSRREVTATIITSSGSKTAVLTARDDYQRNDIGVIKPDRGAWPPAQDQVVIEHSSLAFAELSLGDSVQLRIADGPLVRTGITGVVRDVGVAPGWMEHVVYLFVTPAMLAQLGHTSSMNELQILARDRGLSRSAVRLLADDVGRTLEQRGLHVSDITVPVPGRHIHAGQIDSLLLTQGAFALLTLLLSGVLVINLVSAMLTGQLREIGIMKTLGARASQIAAMYLTFALALGAVACVISIPIAAVFGRFYASFTADLMNFDVSAYSIPWWAFATQVAVGLLLPVIAAAIPVSHGCRIPVGEALRDLGIAPAAEQRSWRMLDHAGDISRPVLLSLRNTFRKRQRLVLTLSTISLGGAVFLGAIDLRASIVRSVDVFFNVQKFDLAFRFARPAPVDSLLAIARSINGVIGAEAWRGARAVVSNDGGPLGASFAITAPPSDTRMLAAPITQGRWAHAGANELVVNRRTIEDVPELTLGRSTQLVIGGKKAAWTVVGIAESGPTPNAYTSREAIEQITGEPGASTVVVATSVPAGSQRLELIRTLREGFAERGFGVASSSSLAQQRNVIEDHLLMVAGFLGNMSLLMIIVGGLALASTMSLAVLERTREIGVLRAIGASHWSILSMIQIEGLVIAVLSWLIAIPLSLPMSVVLGKVFSAVMLPVPITLVPEPSGVIKWLALVVVVSIAACAWPAMRATRITTAAALSYE